MFNGKAFVLLKHGKDMSEVRLKILRRNIEAEEGSVVDLKSSLDEDVNYILFGSGKSLSGHSLNEILSANFPKSSNDNIEKTLTYSRLVSVDWIVDSLKRQCLMKEENYYRLKNEEKHEESKDLGDSQLFESPIKRQKTDELSDHELPVIKSTEEFVFLSDSSEERQIKVKNDPILVEGGPEKERSTQFLGGKTPTKFQNRLVSRKNHFACQKPPDPKLDEVDLPSPDSYNLAILKILKDMEDLYSGMKNEEWRTRNYRLANKAVSQLTFEIYTADDLDRPECKRIGPKTREKIKEYIRSGKISKIQEIKDNPRTAVVSEFCRVWGIGPSTAEDLYNRGYKSLDDLRNHREDLTPNQKIGLELVEDLDQKMPREEADQIIDGVLDHARVVFGTADFELNACGSYRRGKQFCGDVDILICKKDNLPIKDELHLLCQRLRKANFLTHDLTGVESELKTGSHGSLSYMGVCKLTSNSKHRRLDLKMYPRDQYAFALLYFTGCAHFNRSMRLFARKMGYTLSDHDLTKVQRTPGQEKIRIGSCVECFTEEDVFNALGLEYRDPRNRDVDEQWQNQINMLQKKNQEI